MRGGVGCIVCIGVVNFFTMIATEPQVADGGRYSVTQTCAALGIHRNTLERYNAQA